ncbi:conserved Plasmodium protein, unknown function [Plasmodium gallinaceum]|uniref:6-cysteine protein n=1 Tax=Plasmodium gallinaceum TaxID=5849 RepID=A0A1J1GX18_PLAGA|nr:conserved Plasmodium protein, unknown function [Plasmodium gallinaceum]CRG95567.1 conserved Plasmodium protein, unknown function [Plasmodium gallinaceum]
MFALISIILVIFHTKLIIGINNKNKICTCDFTDRLNFIPQQRTKILCDLKPKHGDEVKVIANENYEVSCFNNSTVYCPSKGYFLSNSIITKHSPKLKYSKTKMVLSGRNVSVYHLIIDENASDILFYCYVKPNQVSELLHGVVKIDLKREISEEYSKPLEDGTHVCDYSKGNLNIYPSSGFYYKNSRSVNCIYRVIPNKLFLIKLPKLDIVTESFLPSIVNCLSEHAFINFTLKHVEESEDSVTFHITFGEFTRSFNLSCSMDLSEYNIEPCAVGKKGNVTFFFNV